MVEVGCCIYFLQPLPRFGGVVEVEVYPSNFLKRRGRVGGEVRYGVYVGQPLSHFGGVVDHVLGVWYR